ncbi:MAG: DUF5685 family protein [Acutalibacteraceae bacterium]
MFGYLTPHKPEMKVKHYDLYKSVYCGLCKVLGKQYGFLARLTLSYDCTVLAVLSLAVNKETVCIQRGRCVCNPLKKCEFCCGTEDGSFRLAAGISVIMTYYKLEDTATDSKGIKSFAAKFLKLLFSRCHKKAAADFPQIESDTAQMMKDQQTVEHEQVGVDRSAVPTAELISKICVQLCNENSQKPILKEFGYYVGRWIYLIDAADDLEKDKKKGTFNPFLNTDIQGNSADYCNAVLNNTVARIIAAYDLLGLRGDFSAVLENILYEGIAAVQKRCLYPQKDTDEGK